MNYEERFENALRSLEPLTALNNLALELSAATKNAPQRAQRTQRFFFVRFVFFVVKKSLACGRAGFAIMPALLQARDSFSRVS